MLIWKGQVTESVPFVSHHGFSWDAWYAKNKVRLSEKRAKRYREDAAYRAAALERSRQQRETKKPAPVITDGHTVSFSDAADALGVTIWTLREWRRKNYFPEPHHRDGRLWFSPSQMHALQTLRQFFIDHGTRTSEADRPALESLISLMYANWN